jgi:hypothetical protein
LEQAGKRHFSSWSADTGRRSVVTLALCGLLAAASPASALDDWQRFDSEGGRFSIDMPAVPRTQEKKTWFPMASFVSHVYTSLVGDDAFGVNHTDIPRVVLALAGEKKILESTRNGLLEDMNATEISFRETRVGSLPARELVYDIPPAGDRPPLRGTATILFVGRRLYVFWAEVSQSRSLADLQRYFASVQIDETKP